MLNRILQNFQPVTKRLFRRLLCTIIGRHLYYSIWFWHRHRYWPSLRSPTTLNAKLLWIRLNANVEWLAPFVCKYEVRRFVEARIGRQYLVPIYGVHESFDTIDTSVLPEKFVIKPTHGSKWIVIVKDKNAIDLEQLRRVCRKWLRTDFSALTGEAMYKNVTRRLIVEELLEEQDGDLRDYKWLCYAGQPRYIEIHEGRFKDHRSALLDIKWRVLPMTWGEKPITHEILRPDTFDEMYDIAARLSAPFPFVRVDLYSVGNKVYFGELTFIPGAARIPIIPVEYDEVLGEGLPLVSEYSVYFRQRSDWQVRHH